MYALGRINCALRLSETAIEFDSSSAKGNMNFGRSLQANGQIDDTVSHFSEVIALNGNLADAYGNYAYAQS